MKESSKIVSVYPDPLILTKQRNSNYYESKLNLLNLTNEYIIFKLYNNQQILYSAKPSTSFIPPKETTNVLIKRFAKDESKSPQNDKFLLRIYTINKIINNDDEAKDAFKSKLYNEKSLQESYLIIVLKEQEKKDNDNFLTSESTYNENKLENIREDYDKGIKIYYDLNEKLRNESNEINQRIKELENRIESIKSHQELKNEKDRAILNPKSKNQNKKGYNKKIIIIGLALLGLIIGANLANITNYLYKNNSF